MKRIVTVPIQVDADNHLRCDRECLNIARTCSDGDSWKWKCDLPVMLRPTGMPVKLRIDSKGRPVRCPACRRAEVSVAQGVDNG